MGWSVGLAVGVGSRALPVLVLVLVLPLLVLVLLGGPVCPGRVLVLAALVLVRRRRW